MEVPCAYCHGLIPLTAAQQQSARHGRRVYCLNGRCKRAYWESRRREARTAARHAPRAQWEARLLPPRVRFGQRPVVTQEAQ